jgi:hypothetical protein
VLDGIILIPVIRVVTQVGPLLTDKTEIPRVSRKNVVSSSRQVVLFNDAVGYKNYVAYAVEEWNKSTESRRITNVTCTGLGSTPDIRGDCSYKKYAVANK